MATCNQHRSTWVRACLLALAGLTFAACGGDYLEALDPALNLLEFENRQISCRFVDREGFPIEAARVRFAVDGNANGAVLDSRVAVTDGQGIARVNLRTEHAATFQVRCDADEAREAAVSMIFVARDNGGRLEVQIYPSSAADTIEAEVTLVENFDCQFLNPYQPPAATSHADERRIKQVVQIASTGTPVTFAGLQPDLAYSVVAIGRANNQNVAKGCVDGLSVNQTLIDQNRAVNVTLFLEDFLPDISGNFLEVTSTFDVPIGLRGIAALLARMSDGANDPADYILGMMSTRASGVEQKLINAYRGQIAALLSQDAAAQTGLQDLKTAAAALRDLNEIDLHTKMTIKDEASIDGQTAASLAVVHEFSHFEAKLQGRTQKFFFPEGQKRLLATDPPVLRAEAVMNVEDASQVSFDAHQLSLPVADALISRLFVDTFGDIDFPRVLSTMVACYSVATAVNNIAHGYGLSPSSGYTSWSDWSSLIAPVWDIGIQVAITELCENVVEDIADDIYKEILSDLRASNIDGPLTFEGKASLLMSADGTKISRLVAGHWVGIGDFHAVRAK